MQEQTQRLVEQVESLQRTCAEAERLLESERAAKQKLGAERDELVKKV